MLTDYCRACLVDNEIDDILCLTCTIRIQHAIVIKDEVFNSITLETE